MVIGEAGGLDDDATVSRKRDGSTERSGRSSLLSNRRVSESQVWRAKVAEEVRKWV